MNRSGPREFALNPAAYGLPSRDDLVKLRIWDNRHSLSLPFDQHSAGFRWFFSFLAAFSEYEHRDPPVVILLDEPAVGLHASAVRLPAVH